MPAANVRSRTRVAILGAAGRDFHNFNVVYRNDPADLRSLSHDRIYALYEDSAGELWIGTAVGLDRLDRATGAFVHYQAGLGGNPFTGMPATGASVLAIREDRDQLAGAVNLLIDKKDKICILRNMVLIFFTKEDKDANSLVPLIINNLPKGSPQYLNKITKFIPIYSIKMDKGTQNAEDMFKQLLAADIPDEDKIGLN